LESKSAARVVLEESVSVVEPDGDAVEEIDF
jgi:hypothetical protein